MCMRCWCNYNSKLYLVLLCLHVYDWFDLKTLISSHLWCSVWIVFAVHWEMPLLGRLRMATVLLINSWGKQICLLSLYTIRKNEFKVSLWARTPIFSELIQVSTEWSDKEYAYSPLQWDAKLSQRSLQMLSWTTKTAPPLLLPCIQKSFVASF